MKLFCYDDTDTFVAADEADAWMALLETYGGDRDDFDGAMEELADDATIEIWCDAYGHPDGPEADGSQAVKKTAAEWAASEPRGMLCTTEI